MHLHLMSIRQRILDNLPLRPSPMLHPFLLLPLRVQRHIPALLLDISHHLLLRTCMKDIPALPKQQLQILRHIPPRDVDPAYGAGHGEAFVDGHGMGDAVAGVEHYACGAAGGVKGEHGLDGGVERGNVEGFEEDLRRGFAVRTGVEGGFGEEDWMLFAKPIDRTLASCVQLFGSVESTQGSALPLHSTSSVPLDTQIAISAPYRPNPSLCHVPADTGSLTAPVTPLLVFR